MLFELRARLRVSVSPCLRGDFCFHQLFDECRTKNQVSLQSSSPSPRIVLNHFRKGLFMHGTELLADGLKRSFDMLNMTLSDFSDADMFVRPCPGANHPTW